MSSISSADDDGDIDYGEISLFPLTECGSYESESEHYSETESNRDASDERDSDDDDDDDDEKVEADKKRTYLTLRQRRLSKALAAFEGSLKINVTEAQKNWLRAIRKARNMEDPWEEFHLDDYPTETCIRHRYSALKKAWVTDEVKVKMERKAFNSGAMRECFRLKKLGRFHHNSDGNHTHHGYHHTHNFVAKCYMEEVEREVYFQDVKLQMDAKLWGEEYSRHNPPKKVDIFQMYILEFKNRSGSPLYHCEHYMTGNYIKYNSNSGFVDKCLRHTPQAFSHFTFERSGHQLIIVDIQGVGDLYTDPQIHTIDGLEYGDGNLGAKGMALFFHSHECNDICRSLGLTEFDLSANEKTIRNNRTNMMDAIAHTMARGSESPITTPSPGEKVDVSTFLQLHRQRSTSSTASDSGLESLMSPIDEEEPMSIVGSPVPFLRQRLRYVSESESSVTSTEGERREEDIRNFRAKLQQIHRPSCVAVEKDLRKMNLNARVNDSCLGKIHHEMAKYHEIGRFCDKTEEDIDWDSAIYHETHAAELGELEAILTMAKLYLGQERAVLVNCVVEDHPENVDMGMDYMVEAAEAGDRGAMIFVAKAFHTGDGLGTRRSISWEDAVHWFDEAVNSLHDNDEAGEYDSTMDDPAYQLMAWQAEMYAQGGHGLEKMPERAAEKYNEAAEGAMEAMKGRLANKYFALAEEQWALVED